METSLLISKTTWAIAGLDGVGCKFMAGQLRGVSIALVMPSSHLIISCSLLLCSIFTIKEDGFKQI